MAPHPCLIASCLHPTILHPPLSVFLSWPFKQTAFLSLPPFLLNLFINILKIVVKKM